jgi:hypothetical protein
MNPKVMRNIAALSFVFLALTFVASVDSRALAAACNCDYYGEDGGFYYYLCSEWSVCEFSLEDCASEQCGGSGNVLWEETYCSSTTAPTWLRVGCLGR